MFSFLKKKPAFNCLNDMVWMDAQAKYRNFYHHILAQQQEFGMVVVVTFFQQSFDDLRAIFEKMEIKFQKVESLSDFSKPIQNTSLLLVNLAKSELLLSELTNGLKNQGYHSTIFFGFFEHYPLHSVEQKVLEPIAVQLGKTATVGFYASLDEPFFQLFGGERLVEMLQKMGWGDENEPITHALITKSIERAQKRIDEKISNETKAHSQIAWFEFNQL